MSLEIGFFVPGLPKPAGSKRGFVNKRTGGVIIVDACKKSKDWQADVKHFAFQAYQGDPLTGPIYLKVKFIMPRPKYHYRTGRHSDELKPSAPLLHTKTPDRTKLLRGLEDALTGVIWKDDCQVVDGPVSKIYGEKTGAEVIVAVMDDEQLKEGRK